MTTLTSFHAVEHATVMETIMKPLSYARRGARWLMAAGLALASITPVAAQTKLPVGELPAITLDRPERPERETREVRPFFEKIGRQRDCNYVEYRLRFGLRGDPERIADPAFAAQLKAYRMDLSDQLPNGLTVVHVTASGDGTDAAGGALPAAAIGATADPGDTALLEDFRLSTVDLDGSGEVGERYIEVRITAKIDPGAFPAPAIVDNQAWVNISVPGAPTVHIPSHDPAKPDDGDFLTGDMTSILVDLTGCEPPPPPGGGDPEEACFKVETGDVDCTPFAGTYVYHMTVGADLAGKWVQVHSTNPGVTVAEGPQLVPAGGGVLDWTIHGAGPGDVIHLVVTGIDTYAGPAEGVGLCCTQTVDIVIPPDLDCPDQRGEPDLKVEKRADVPHCTAEGGCEFTITVTNVGDAPYNGKIVLEEVTAPGSATVESGPNAPWTCVPMASPMMCEHPVTTLNPGESVTLKLGFEPGAAWQWRGIRNCAEYDYKASGKEPFGELGNDRACTSIPICVPGRDRECTPVDKKADLGIRKSALTPVCSPDGVCLWRIDVINTGTSTYNGPITVIDEYPSGVPVSSDFVPSPPWACVPNGPGSFRCDHPGLVLVPGATTTIGVKTVAGADYGDVIENCAEVQPVPTETNLANNRSCAKAEIPHRDPGKPALRITKTCDGAVAGAAISCRITVHSVGTAAPSGPVRVSDAATLIGSGTPVQIQTVTPDGPEWACGPVPANALSCQIPGSEMTPGTSRYFDVTLSVSPNGRFKNCARGSFGPAPGNDIVYPFGEACDEGGSTIHVDKTGDRECRVGQPCTFEITISNEGDTGFSGPVRIGDALGVEGIGRLEGLPITEISPAFGCAVEPTTLPFSCVANLTLGAGESRVHRVTVVIPESAVANGQGQLTGRNCVAVLSPETPVTGVSPGQLSRALTVDGDREGDSYSCHPFTISQEVAKQCSEGFVLNADDRCVCPEGTTFRNGQCVTDGGTIEPKPPVRLCKLLPGQIRTADGQCVCPKGTELKDSACRKIEQPPVRQCKLLPGQIRTQDGRCICPRETELKDGACRKIEQPPVRQCKLLPGQIRTQDGRCICPRGTELKDSACRKIEQPPVRQCKLLPGQIRTKDGLCVCPRGTELRDGACRKREIVCKKGTVLQNGTCVPIDNGPRCRKGQVVRNGKCVDVSIELRCPKGTIGTPPNCRTPERKNPILEINPNIVNPDVLRNLLPRREKQDNGGGATNKLLKIQ